MSSVHRKKIANKYAHDLDDLFFGDDEAAAKAQQGLDVVSLLAKGAGEFAGKAAEAKKAKADAEKKAAAEKAARDARAKAVEDANAYEIAMFKSSQSPNDKGLQLAALQAKQKALKSDADARELEMKAGMSTSMVPGGGMPSVGSSGRPWYFWPAVIGGVVVGGAIIYRVFSPSRAMREAR